MQPTKFSSGLGGNLVRIIWNNHSTSYVVMVVSRESFVHERYVVFGSMASGGSSTARVKWLSDQEKNVLLSNFEKRGWVKGSSEGM